MEFCATEQQLKQIVFNAIESSKPPLTHGAYLLWSPELPFKAENIELKFQGSWLNIDYICGRCVKLFIRKIAEDFYEIKDEPTPESQTWARKYPTNESSINSVINRGSTNILECSPLEGFIDG